MADRGAGHSCGKVVELHHSWETLRQSAASDWERNATLQSNARRAQYSTSRPAERSSTMLSSARLRPNRAAGDPHPSLTEAKFLRKCDRGIGAGIHHLTKPCRAIPCIDERNW